MEGAGRKRPRVAFAEINPYGYDPILPTLLGDWRLNPGKGLGNAWHPSQPVRNTWSDFASAERKIFDYSKRTFLPTDPTLVGEAAAAKLSYMDLNGRDIDPEVDLVDGIGGLSTSATRLADSDLGFDPSLENQTTGMKAPNSFHYANLAAPLSIVSTFVDPKNVVPSAVAPSKAILYQSLGIAHSFAVKRDDPSAHRSRRAGSGNPSWPVSPSGEYEDVPGPPSRGTSVCGRGQGSGMQTHADAMEDVPAQGASESDDSEGMERPTQRSRVGSDAAAASSAIHRQTQPARQANQALTGTGTGVSLFSPSALGVMTTNVSGGTSCCDQGFAAEFVKSRITVTTASNPLTSLQAFSAAPQGPQPVVEASTTGAAVHPLVHPALFAIMSPPRAHGAGGVSRPSGPPGVFLPPAAVDTTKALSGTAGAPLQGGPVEVPVPRPVGLGSKPSTGAVASSGLGSDSAESKGNGRGPVMVSPPTALPLPSRVPLLATTGVPLPSRVRFISYTRPPPVGVPTGETDDEEDVEADAAGRVRSMRLAYGAANRRQVSSPAITALLKAVRTGGKASMAKLNDDQRRLVRMERTKLNKRASRARERAHERSLILLTRLLEGSLAALTLAQPGQLRAIVHAVAERQRQRPERTGESPSSASGDGGVAAVLMPLIRTCDWADEVLSLPAHKAGLGYGFGVTGGSTVFDGGAEGDGGTASIASRLGPVHASRIRGMLLRLLLGGTHAQEPVGGAPSPSSTAFAALSNASTGVLDLAGGGVAGVSHVGRAGGGMPSAPARPTRTSSRVLDASAVLSTRSSRARVGGPLGPGDSGREGAGPPSIDALANGAGGGTVEEGDTAWLSAAGLPTVTPRPLLLAELPVLPVDPGTTLAALAVSPLAALAPLLATTGAARDRLPELCHRSALDAALSSRSATVLRSVRPQIEGSATAARASMCTLEGLCALRLAAVSSSSASPGGPPMAVELASVLRLSPEQVSGLRTALQPLHMRTCAALLRRAAMSGEHLNRVLASIAVQGTAPGAGGGDGSTSAAAPGGGAQEKDEEEEGEEEEGEGLAVAQAGGASSTSAAACAANEILSQLPILGAVQREKFASWLASQPLVRSDGRTPIPPSALPGPCSMADLGLPSHDDRDGSPVGGALVGPGTVLDLGGKAFLACGGEGAVRDGQRVGVDIDAELDALYLSHLNSAAEASAREKASIAGLKPAGPPQLCSMMESELSAKLSRNIGMAGGQGTRQAGSGRPRTLEEQSAPQAQAAAAQALRDKAKVAMAAF